MGLLPRPARRYQGVGRADAAEPARCGRGGGVHLRAHLGARHLAGRARGVRLQARRPGRAPLFFCPVAYVLSLAYTEGLFLTAAAGCLFALSRRYWVSAALFACLAGLTRNTGIVLALVVGVAALPAAWRGRTVRPAVAAVIAPLGFASFMAYSWVTVGTPVAFLTSERFWHGQHFVWFMTPVEGLVNALGHGPGEVTFVADSMAGVALILGFLGSGCWTA